MAELLNGLKRTKMCGEFRSCDIGKEVVVMGFIGKYRNLGNLLFIDVRDRSGIVQVSFDETTPKDIFEKAERLRNEFVVACVGVVRSRGGNVNKNIPTGEIEIIASDLRILSEAEVAPFIVNDDANVGEQLRLKYRYIDLRRPSLQKIMAVRSKISHIARNYLDEHGFLEVETPYLGKSSPEGARDYLVPSRIHKGEFYALPQSPQLFKQLLMISGTDRYYQIAKCFRDEDLRANRQPEFSQIDFEMSYVEDPEDVMEIAEGLIKEIFGECLGMTFDGKFRRMPYATAMSRYGSDKPDTRFGLEIEDICDIAKDSGFPVFKDAVSNGLVVKAINAKGLAESLSRKDIDKLVAFVKDYGVKGLPYIAIKESGVSSSFMKFMSEDELNAIIERMGAEKGDILFFAADSYYTACTSLGALRLHLANTFDLYDRSKYDFLWVVDFPLLEYSEEEKRYVAVHHPFTSAKSEDLPLLDSDPLKVRANAYDLVINGEESGGGSIRIHDVKMQKKMFNLLGMSEEDIKLRFGFFVDAFRYGAPPHGGLAFGLDRLVMLVTGTDNIKDVIAFPKVQNASCLMTDAPSVVEDKQLDELSLIIDKCIDEQ